MGRSLNNERQNRLEKPQHERRRAALTFTPDATFWLEWKTDRRSLVAAGYRVRKLDNGKWVAWIMEP